MKTYQATLESVSPLIFSRMLDPNAGEAKKLEREQHDVYDRRITKLKAWSRPSGRVYIPRIFFKRALEEAGPMLGLQIPGKGKSTYTKHLLAGVQIGNDLELDLETKDLEIVSINCHVDGKRGSGKRVVRTFPQVNEWSGTLSILVVDEVVTESVLLKHLDTAGRMIGIGSFRVKQGNMSGMFSVTDLQEVG